LTRREKHFGKRINFLAAEMPAKRHCEHPIWYCAIPVAPYVAVNELELAMGR
jgi:hypothetical protein